MEVYLVYNLQAYEDRDVGAICPTYESALKKEYEIYKEKHKWIRESIGDSHLKWIWEDDLCYKSYETFDDFCANFEHDIEEWKVEE